MIEFSEQLLLLLLALTSNTLSAIAGGGAGLIQLPVLIFLGLPFSVALATHKIATVALGVGASVNHFDSGYKHWFYLFIIITAGMPGVILGAHIVLTLPSHLAQVLLGLLTIGLGAYSLFKPKLGQDTQLKKVTPSTTVIGAIGLFICGFLNGAFSSGTGLFVTLWMISWFGLDFKKATASTMIAVGLIWNATGAITFSQLSPVQWSWIPMLLLGSLLGGYFGVQLSKKYGNKLVKRVFEIMTIMVGIALISKSIS